jgi:hypothetical protein
MAERAPKRKPERTIDKAERTKHKARVQRCVTQGLRLLDIDDTRTCFKIMGSTGTEYTVTLNELNITCNCQDCIRRTRKCKHILFVLSRILQLDENDLERMGPRAVLEPHVRDDLVKRADGFVQHRAQRPANRETDDTCGICLEPFKAVIANVRDCEQCWHTAHADCLREWHMASRHSQRTCPFCRAVDKMGDPHILRVLKAWKAEKPTESSAGQTTQTLTLDQAQNTCDPTECVFE